MEPAGHPWFSPSKHGPHLHCPTAVRLGPPAAIDLHNRMFGLFPFTFRFRGKVRGLFEMYRCFLAHPGEGLHPTQIVRHTGIGFMPVMKMLDRTPELFVRLPKRGGLTRYRLTSAMAAREPEEVENFLSGQARRESMILFAVGVMVLCALMIIVIMIGPAL